MISKALVADIIRFIREPGSTTFEALALQVFAYQFERNRLYRAYCESRDATPETIRRWEEIPAVPTRVFTCVDLLCGPPQRVFLTSGTTQGIAKRGRHGFPCLSLYDAAAVTNFAACVLPDLAGLGGRILTCGLMLSPEHRPDSSLAYMIDLVIRMFGRGAAGGGRGSAFYIKEGGLDLPGLTTALHEATKAGQPVLLLGPTSGFVHLFEACRTDGLRFALPAGSRVMDTGGTKGLQGRVFTRDAFYAACAEWLGIPADWCVNEYGMTEMGSQFYDHVIRSRHSGLPTRPRYKTIPHWVRTRILDPETLEPVRPGETGLLCHVDLANAGSVMAIQTEDLGVACENGFEMLGRVIGSEARGCSLALDEFLAGAGAAPHPPLWERMPR